MNKLFIVMALFLISIISVSAQPTLPAIPSVTVTETDTVTINITLAAGPDNGNTVWATNFSSLFLAQSNNTFAKYTWTTGYSDAGVYSVKFNVSDADSSDAATATITVNNLNRAPTITSTAVTTAVVGQPYTYDVNGNDADGDTLTYGLGANAPLGMTINSASGIITWTPSTAGTYPVTARVSDGQATGEQNFSIVVSNPTAALSLSAPTLGGSSQDRDENVTATLTVTNSGTATVTGTVLTISADSRYKVSLSQTTIASLSPGQSTSVTVEGYIPDDYDSGKHSIGTITATGTSGSSTITANSNLYMEAENNLDIRKLRVTVDGDESSLDDGDSVDMFPGSDIQMEVDLKNTLKDYKIEDITVTIYNDDLDIDDDKDISSIKHGKTGTATFKFTIDADTDDDKYDLDVTVEGTDENGAMHSDSWSIEFNVDRTGILISKADLSPKAPSCQDKSVDLRLELYNIGRSDEDDAAVEIIADTLKYEKRLSYLSIPEDEKITKTFTIPLNGATSGLHVIEITAFKDYDEQTSRKYVYLSVPSSCQTNNTVTPPPVTPPPVVPKNDTGADNDADFVDAGKGGSIISSLDTGVWGTVLLVLANVLVLVIIIILVVKFLVRF